MRMTRLLALILTLGFMATGHAQPAWPTPPEIAARAWLLVDLTSNQILAAKDPDTAVEPASLTKLMTAYLVFQALQEKRLSPDQVITVSERAWKMPGSRMFIEPRKAVTVDELVKGMVVQSGNDATVALAEAVGGTVEQFVERMNRQATTFGLKGTTFVNPEGLTAPGHTTTVRDLSIIATRLIRDFPDYYATYSIREYTYNNIRQPNRNRLLFTDPTVDGLKTGHTDAAGYCLIASAERAFPNGKRRLLSVMVGTTSETVRATETQRLLNWGYQSFDALRLFQPLQPVTTVEVWKGEARTVGLGTTMPVVVAVPRGEGDKVRSVVERTDPLIAPLRAGDQVGRVRVSVGSTVLADAPLTVLEDVPEAGLLGRLWDALRLWIK